MKILVNMGVLVCILSGGVATVGASAKEFGRNFSQPIPAQGDGEAWMTPVSLLVPEHFAVIDLDVYLDITHSEIRDLVIYLDAPQGPSIELKDDEMFHSIWKDAKRPNMYGTVFDDEAVQSLMEGSPPYTGDFWPVASLKVFNGLDAYGIWTLRIYDLAFVDSGTLDRWLLRFEARVAPEPMSLLYILPPLILGRLRKSSHP